MAQIPSLHVVKSAPDRSRSLDDGSTKRRNSREEAAIRQRRMKVVSQCGLGAGLVGLWLFLGWYYLETFSLAEALPNAVTYLLFFILGVFSRYLVGYVMPAQRKARGG